MKVRQWVGLIAAIAACVYTIAYRFQHPGLTETELFLHTWPAVLVVVVGVALMYRGDQ